MQERYASGLTLVHATDPGCAWYWWHSLVPVHLERLFCSAGNTFDISLQFQTSLVCNTGRSFLCKVHRHMILLESTDTYSFGCICILQPDCDHLHVLRRMVLGKYSNDADQQTNHDWPATRQPSHSLPSQVEISNYISHPAAGLNSRTHMQGFLAHIFH